MVGVAGFDNRGVWLGVVVLLAGAVLVTSAPPAGYLTARDVGNGDREYALDALALQYLSDYVDDPEVTQRIGGVYWCWTPVFEQLDRLTEAETSEAALRARAQRLARVDEGGAERARERWERVFRGKNR